MRTMDMPEHAVQKRMLNRDFTIRRMEEMRLRYRPRSMPSSTGYWPRPPADIVRDFAFPLPMMVICELWAFPTRIGTISPIVRRPACRWKRVSRRRRQRSDLYDYTDKLLDRKDANPENDLLSRLMVEQVRTGNLPRKEVIEIARLILVAGYETTANTIALCVIVLLQHPEQAAELRADPALIPNAVEELLRYRRRTRDGGA